MSQNTFKKRPQDGAIRKCVATRQKAIIARPSNIVTLPRVPARLQSHEMFHIFKYFLVIFCSTRIYLFLFYVQERKNVNNSNTVDDRYSV